MLDEDFVPYDESMELKKLGFDEPCYEAYNIDGNGGESGIPAENYNYRLDVISRPTISQAFRWFRDNYNLNSWIEKYTKEDPYIFQIPSANFEKIQGYFGKYEEAELACLRKLIKIAKERK
jgi:hypothetical protein